MEKPLARICLALVVALAAAPAAFAGEEVVRKTKTFDLAVDEGLEVESSVAREIEKELEDGFEAAGDLLGLGTRQIFYEGLPTPSWMGDAGRLRFVLRRRVREDSVSVDRWTKELFAGGYRMDLRLPGEEITPAYRGLLRRAAGVAVLGNTLYRTSVPWWTEGVLARLQTRAAGEEAVAALRAEVAKIPAQELPGRTKALLAAATSGEFEAAGGRALAFVLVDLLVEGGPEIVEHLQRQLQTMAYHLWSWPSEEALTAEFVAIARHALTESIPERDLAAALVAWVAEGFPTGADFRKLREVRAVRRADPGDPYGAKVEGHWSSTRTDADGNRLRTWEGGSVAFRLPPIVRTAVLWCGVHEKLPRGERFEPDRMEDGLAIDLHRWSKTSEDRVSIPETPVHFGWVRPEYEFALLKVESERGLVFRFYRYGKCR